MNKRKIKILASALRKLEARASGNTSENKEFKKLMPLAKDTLKKIKISLKGNKKHTMELSSIEDRLKELEKKVKKMKSRR